MSELSLGREKKECFFLSAAGWHVQTSVFADSWRTHSRDGTWKGCGDEVGGWGGGGSTSAAAPVAFGRQLPSFFPEPSPQGLSGDAAECEKVIRYAPLYTISAATASAWVLFHWEATAAAATAAETKPSRRKERMCPTPSWPPACPAEGPWMGMTHSEAPVQLHGSEARVMGLERDREQEGHRYSDKRVHQNRDNPLGF